MNKSSELLGYAMALPLQEGEDARSFITFDVSENKLSEDLNFVNTGSYLVRNIESSNINTADIKIPTGIN